MGRRKRSVSIWSRLISLVRRRWFVTTVIGVLVLILAVQLLYPSNTSTPLAKIAGKYHGFTPSLEVEKTLQSMLDDTTLGISVQGEVGEHNLRNIGGDIDIRRSANEFTSYPMVMRFIPLSIVFYSPEIEDIHLEFDRGRLKEFAQNFSEDKSVQPKNANVRIENGEIAVDSSERGFVIQVDELIDRVESQEYKYGEASTFAAPLEFVTPEIEDEDINQAREQLEAALNKQVVITEDETSRQFTPNKETIASWLSVDRAEDDTLVVSVNPENVRSYVAELNGQVGSSPDPVSVIYRDGREIERSGGSSGVGIIEDRFIEDIQVALFLPAPYSYVTLGLEDIPPPEAATFTYTNTEAGLAAKLDELTSRYNAKISVQQLSGGRWTANSKGSETWPSASTYKLYVAAMLFSKIESGEMSWGGQTAGRSVSSCFESMIVVSANDCSEEWLRQFGRSNLERFLRQLGVSDATRFTDTGPARTSANDLVHIMSSYHSGNIASNDNKNRLYDAMSRQIWRKGIPDGSAGPVHDKVGFLWDYVHDAGIVNHPRGTYALAVMTKGHNYGTISQITKEIEEVMYP